MWSYIQYSEGILLSRYSAKSTPLVTVQDYTPIGSYTEIDEVLSGVKWEIEMQEGKGKKKNVSAENMVQGMKMREEQEW